MKVEQRKKCLKTPVEESMKYLHLRKYLISAKKIRETWISNSTNGINQK